MSRLLSALMLLFSMIHNVNVMSMESNGNKVLGRERVLLIGNVYYQAYISRSVQNCVELDRCWDSSPDDCLILCPVIPDSIKTQIRNCFSNEDVLTLSKNSFKAKMYPRVDSSGRILGFYLIIIKHNKLKSFKDVSNMHFLGSMISFLEKNVRVDVKNIEGRAKDQCYNDISGIAISFKDTGAIVLSRADY